MNKANPGIRSKDRRPAYFVYIVRCSDGSLYTGITSDVPRRIREHNSGTASKYTRTRTPVVLSYLEAAPGRGDALRRERQIKGLGRELKLLLCSNSSAPKGLVPAGYPSQ